MAPNQRHSSPQHSERTPLLADVESTGVVDLPSSQDEEGGARDSILSVQLVQRISIMALISFVGPFVDTPSSQILEAIICRSFHPDIANGFDQRCKGDDVQGELSTINGWLLTFSLLPGLLTAVPYGVLADKVGQKFVLNLSIFGHVLAQASAILVYRMAHILPVRLVWFSCCFNLIGGGPTVFAATLFALIGDSVPKDYRTVVFSYAGAVTMGAVFTASPLVYLIMKWSDWLCVYIGLGLYALSLVLGLTMSYQPTPRQSTADSPSGSVSSRFVAGARTFITEIRSQLVGNTNLTLLLCSVMFTSLGKAFTHILNQYVTRRYGWSWSEAGLIDTLRTIIVVFVMSVLVPALDYLLRNRYGWTLFKKDMWMARACIVAMVVGYLGVSVAPNSAILLTSLSISSFAAGYEFILRSLLGQAAYGHNVATVYTAMSVLETSSLLVSGPVLAATFRLGLQWGGPWLGIPFVVAALLVGFGGLILLAMKEVKKTDDINEDE